MKLGKDKNFQKGIKTQGGGGLTAPPSPWIRGLMAHLYPPPPLCGVATKINFFLLLHLFQAGNNKKVTDTFSLHDTCIK